MPSKKPRITVYLTQEELQGIEASAARAGISLSQFARLVCQGFAVPSLEHAQAVRDLLKVSADLARLGGLYKLALSGQPTAGERATLNMLLRQLETAQRELRAAIARLA